LGHGVEKAFSRLGIANGEEAELKTQFERMSYFMQLADPRAGLASTLCQPYGNFFPAKEVMEDMGLEGVINDMIIRRERQTFRRLQCGKDVSAVLFGVNTYVEFIKDMETSELRALVEDIRLWDEKIADYKARDVWFPFLEAYLKQRERS